MFPYDWETRQGNSFGGTVRNHVIAEVVVSSFFLIYVSVYDSSILQGILFHKSVPFVLIDSLPVLIDFSNILFVYTCAHCALFT